MVTQERKRVGERVTSAANEAMAKPKEMLHEYPLSSMLVVFGLGMGVGVIIGQALIPAYHEPTVSERMGRQLHDSMANLSNMVGRTFHS